MGIRGKTITIVVAAFVCANGAFLGLARLFYARGIDTFERQAATEAFGRVLSLAQDDLDQVALVATDWGVWDDTYDYVEFRDREYEKSNLYEQALQSIQLAFFAIYDIDGGPVVAREVPGTERMTGTSALRREVGPGSTLYEKALADELATAVVVTDNGVELVCARQILRSDGSGPPAGILIMTRRLDASRVARWARLTGTFVSVAVAKESQPPSTITLRREMGGLVQARGLLPGGAAGAGSAEAVVSPLRPHRGVSDGLFFGLLLTLAFVTLVIGGAALFIISRLVLRRLSSLGADMERIAASGTPTLRVGISGHDELTRFGEIINKTLDALERSFLDNERDRSLLTASLQERDAMFREIRHRVKNNLQVVASLLSLQADNSDRATRIALHESRRRVLAMAFVHEELYSSESMDRISLAEYLSRLSVSVRTGAEEEKRIQFSSDFDPVVLEIDRAVPFGLIANEVLTNAYTHAFPPEKTGGNTIFMQLKRSQEHMAIFSVRDNGIGMPADIDKKNNLGLSLVHTLAEQLNAQVEFERQEDGGTRFSMVFRASYAKTSG